MSVYEKYASDFLHKANAKMVISHISDNGEWKRSPMTGGYLYKVRIDRNGKSWTFQFSDCAANYKTNNRPGKYDVLACIEKYKPYGDVWDFATEFGYEIHDRDSFAKTEKIFNSVLREYKNVIRMFGDVIDELREIQ